MHPFEKVSPEGTYFNRHIAIRLLMRNAIRSCFTKSRARKPRFTMICRLIVSGILLNQRGLWEWQ